MELRLEVENVKCGGCARSIEQALARRSAPSARVPEAGEATRIS
jgi:copper chaperone CopZ